MARVGEGKEFPGNVVFKSVGNWVACTADPLEGGIFRVKCGFEQGSLFSDDVQKAGSQVMPPVLRTFSSDATLLLRDGQTARHLMATDSASGEVVKVEVTLAVIK